MGGVSYGGGWVTVEVGGAIVEVGGATVEVGGAQWRWESLVQSIATLGAKF